MPKNNKNHIICKRIDDNRVIRKRVDSKQYYALQDSYESGGAFPLAKVTKEKHANNKTFWQVYLVSNPTDKTTRTFEDNPWQPSLKPAAERYIENTDFKTLNAAFNCLNENF